MSKIEVRFLEDGQWGDEPGKPVFSVKANEVVEVTARLAKIATDAGKAVFLGKGQVQLSSEEDSEKFANLIEREKSLDEREYSAVEVEDNLVAREDKAAELETSLADAKADLDKREDSLTEWEEALIEREKELPTVKPGPVKKGKTGPKDKAET